MGDESMTTLSYTPAAAAYARGSSHILCTNTASPTLTTPSPSGTPLQPTHGFSLSIASSPVRNFISTLNGTALSASPVSGLTFGSCGCAGQPLGEGYGVKVGTKKEHIPSTLHT